MYPIAFIGFRHSHILGLSGFVQQSAAFASTGACEDNAAAHAALRVQFAADPNRNIKL